MYPIDYDTCSRYISGEDCNKGIGLGGKKCYYENKKCMSEK